MRIRLEWRGNTDTEDGIAIYRTETNTFELHLPSMQRARQIEQALCTVYADGRRCGKKMQARLVRATQSEYAKLG